MAVIFIGLLVVFLLCSLYVASRVCRAMKTRPKGSRIAVWAVVLLLDASFFLSRVIDTGCVWLQRLIYVISTWWLPVAMLLFATIGAMNAVRLVIRANTGHDPYRTPLTVRVGAVVTAALCVIGHTEAVSTRLTRYSVYTAKLPRGESRRVILASDIHTGYAVTNDDVARLVEDINSLAGDVVILAGDIIDGDLLPVKKERAYAKLADIRPPHRVVAVMGNHEYMDDDNAAEHLLRGTEGLTLLRDESVELAGMRIIGRDDLAHNRTYPTPRKPLDEFGAADSVFTIVVDHQPGAISEAVSAGADLCLSGHTHAGQIWPMSILTDLIYDIDYGYGCFGNTSAIVTSGFGTWGPRMRLGSHSEIVAIDIIGNGREAETEGPEA